MAMILQPIEKVGSNDGFLALPMGKRLYAIYGITNINIFVKSTDGTEVQVHNNSGQRQVEFMNPLEFMDTKYIVLRSSSPVTATAHALIEG